MKTSQIKIQTHNFRAINKADIIIDGITVVAGENGSGKSTMSKLLYYLYKTVSNYNNLISKDLEDKLRDVSRFLEIIAFERHSSKENELEEEQLIRDYYSLFQGNMLTEERMNKWVSVLDKVYRIFYSEDTQHRNIKSFTRLTRFKFILKDILDDNNISIESENTELQFQKIIDLVKSIFDDAFNKKKFRPSSLFIDELETVFGIVNLPEKFEVQEYGETIFSSDKDRLAIPYSIQNAIYIDTPMVIGSSSDNEYWEDLNELLRKKGKLNNSQISQLISKEIIKGDISIEDNDFSISDFFYKRADGSIYNLLDCATGIKSFGIIQLLLKNGSLTDKTLLIIDEPESHLHPQWIIEYARLIVLLNKEIGVKFFIPSHNPDMVSAIKSISEKEGILDEVNFYIAKTEEKEYQYDYIHLGTDIEPIFESFNIALDRINKYGI
ncbi:AAA family ATPase [Flavobacterium salilacus subsp. salilacus]|uniref:AAA family ATPase n=1 Tax=Flavobacterium TaxID=237 RepID=UPI001074EB2E|nr:MULTISPECIES: AAA family ATPase [Flavobacterium]KAF2518360.1 AAA family ATPase [Flavobacterium salilacus subsp. salilacus]MBE1615224.1 ATP-binding protein [Flavobacterium sp. SaA2.13]